jgi:hypothetical protein
MTQRPIGLAGAICAAALVLGQFGGTAAAGTPPGMSGMTPPHTTIAAPRNAAANPRATGTGTDEFGKTSDYDAGRLLEDVYSKGYYCDTSVPAMSATGCEVGTFYNTPPAAQFDPLYITVPLGFNVPPMQMQCPSALVCVDHPATIDLTAIGGPANAATPGHDHFTTTLFHFKPEWWNVLVVGVTNRTTWDAIKLHADFAYINRLIKAKDPSVTAPIPTNLFLYFAVEPLGQ